MFDRTYVQLRRKDFPMTLVFVVVALFTVTGAYLLHQFVTGDLAVDD